MPHQEALLKPSPDPLILFGNRDGELHPDGTERNRAPCARPQQRRSQFRLPARKALGDAGHQPGGPARYVWIKRKHSKQGCYTCRLGYSPAGGRKGDEVGEGNAP